MPGRADHRRASAGLLPLALALLLLPGCTQIKRWAYASGDRDRWQQPERVVAALGLEPGDRVADLGAGGGYFTFRLARAVGPGGRVLALDVDAAMNEALERDAREGGHANVEVIRVDPDDIGLPPASVDLVFTSNTYHHLGDRIAYFARVRGALAPGGRVAIVEYRPEGFFQKRHATAPDTIRAEMQAAGYRQVADHDFLERQSFLVFAPRES